jgi:hypothetical protein
MQNDFYAFLEILGGSFESKVRFYETVETPTFYVVLLCRCGFCLRIHTKMLKSTLFPLQGTTANRL